MLNAHGSENVELGHTHNALKNALKVAARKGTRRSYRLDTSRCNTEEMTGLLELAAQERHALDARFRNLSKAMRGLSSTTPRARGIKEKSTSLFKSGHSDSCASITKKIQKSRSMPRRVTRNKPGPASQTKDGIYSDHAATCTVQHQPRTRQIPPHEKISAAHSQISSDGKMNIATICPVEPDEKLVTLGSERTPREQTPSEQTLNEGYEGRINVALEKKEGQISSKSEHVLEPTMKSHKQSGIGKVEEPLLGSMGSTHTPLTDIDATELVSFDNDFFADGEENRENPTPKSSEPPPPCTHVFREGRVTSPGVPQTSFSLEKFHERCDEQVRKLDQEKIRETGQKVTKTLLKSNGASQEQEVRGSCEYKPPNIDRTNLPLHRVEADRQWGHVGIDKEAGNALVRWSHSQVPGCQDRHQRPSSRSYDEENQSARAQIKKEPNPEPVRTETKKIRLNARKHSIQSSVIAHVDGNITPEIPFTEEPWKRKDELRKGSSRQYAPSEELSEIDWGGIDTDSRYEWSNGLVEEKQFSKLGAMGRQNQPEGSQIQKEDQGMEDEQIWNHEDNNKEQDQEWKNRGRLLWSLYAEPTTREREAGSFRKEHLDHTCGNAHGLHSNNTTSIGESWIVNEGSKPDADMMSSSIVVLGPYRGLYDRSLIANGICPPPASGPPSPRYPGMGQGPGGLIPHPPTLGPQLHPRAIQLSADTTGKQGGAGLYTIDSALLKVRCGVERSPTSGLPDRLEAGRVFESLSQRARMLGTQHPTQLHTKTAWMEVPGDKNYSLKEGSEGMLAKFAIIRGGESRQKSRRRSTQSSDTKPILRATIGVATSPDYISSPIPLVAQNCARCRPERTAQPHPQFEKSKVPLSSPSAKDGARAIVTTARQPNRYASSLSGCPSNYDHNFSSMAMAVTASAEAASQAAVAAAAAIKTSSSTSTVVAHLLGNYISSSSVGPKKGTNRNNVEDLPVFGAVTTTFRKQDAQRGPHRDPAAKCRAEVTGGGGRSGGHTSSSSSSGPCGRTHCA